MSSYTSSLHTFWHTVHLIASQRLHGQQHSSSPSSWHRLRRVVIMGSGQAKSILDNVYFCFTHNHSIFAFSASISCALHHSMRGTRSLKHWVAFFTYHFVLTHTSPQRVYHTMRGACGKSKDFFSTVCHLWLLLFCFYLLIRYPCWSCSLPFYVHLTSHET